MNMGLGPKAILVILDAMAGPVQCLRCGQFGPTALGTINTGWKATGEGFICPGCSKAPDAAHSSEEEQEDGNYTEAD